MKATHATCACAVAVAALCVISTMTPAGDLNPPPGALTETMKTLDQVEPRIPVNAENTPGDSTSVYRISAPGSYYLTQSHDGAGLKSHILIDSDSVTLDLMGFSLRGVRDSVAGVTVAANVRNVVIQNGVVVNFDGVGITSESALGNVRIQDITTQRCSTGIKAGPGTLLTECLARECLGSGIWTGDDSVVRDCIALENGGSGFTLGKGSTVERCVAADNDAQGFACATGRSVLRQCTSRTNGASGYALGADCIISECVATSNTMNGISAGGNSLVRACTVEGNTGNGIYVLESTLVCQNMVYSNDGHGIYAVLTRNTIDGNKVVGSGGADIQLDGGSFNVVVRNTVGSAGISEPPLGFIGPSNDMSSPWTNFTP